MDISKLESRISENIMKYLTPEDRDTMIQVIPEWAEVKLLRKFRRIIFNNAKNRRENLNGKPTYEKIRDDDHRIFDVKRWQKIESTLKMCANLESVKLHNADFVDKQYMPKIGQLLSRVHSLELRYCRQLHLNGLKYLVDPTVELRQFAFYYNRDRFSAVYDRQAEFAANIFQNLLTRNRHLHSLTIWDDVHDYSTFTVDRPMTSINIMAEKMTVQFWQSLRETSHESLRQYISPRFQLELEGEPMVYKNLIDLRVGELTFVPHNWQLPNIEILSIRFDTNMGAVPSTRVQWTYGCHPQLRVLDVNFQFDRELHFHALCHCCPQLRLLRIVLGYRVGFITLQHISRLKNLEVLIIKLGIAEFQGAVEDADIVDMVSRLPNLRVLLCGAAGEQTFNAFTQLALQNPHQMYFARLGHVAVAPDNMIAHGLLSEEFSFFPVMHFNNDIFDKFDYFLWKRHPVPNQ